MAGLSDYLAAERTFLAWLRTGLALMGFGFVVARFGLFLRALSINAQEVAQTPHFSVWIGTALVLLGVAVNLLAALHHVRLVRELNQGITSFDRPSRLAKPSGCCRRVQPIGHSCLLRFWPID